MWVEDESEGAGINKDGQDNSRESSDPKSSLAGPKALFLRELTGMTPRARMELA